MPSLAGRRHYGNIRKLRTYCICNASVCGNGKNKEGPYVDVSIGYIYIYIYIYILYIYNIYIIYIYIYIYYIIYIYIYIKSYTQSSLVARLGKRQRYSRSVPKTNWKWGKLASPARL